MAPPRRRTRSTGMSPGAMGGRVGSPVTSAPKPSTMSPGERKARTGFTAPKQDLAKQFFKGPVSDDRLRRRLQQDREERDFISQLKVAPGTTNLLQEQAPKFNPMTGRYERTTLAQKRQQLANLYGPTPREVLSDISYGLGSIGSAIGQKVMAGEFGLLGLAKGLYEKFSSNATKAKDALVKGVNKLSDIDLEVLKNKDQYKFLSKKPEIQEVDNLQKTQMTEFDKANLIRQNMEKISMPVTEKDNTVESAKVFDDSFRRLPATGMTQTSPTIDPFRRLPGSGYQAGAGMGIAAIDPGYEIVSDYKSPEVRMQELINQNQINNTNMFDLGINKANNQISELERVFGVDMQ